MSLQTAGQGTPKLQCRIVAELGDNHTLIRTPRTDGSYLSTNDHRVIFGLGHYADDVTLRVHWSDDSVETFKDIQIDQYVTLKKGEGVVE